MGGNKVSLNTVCSRKNVNTNFNCLLKKIVYKEIQ